MVLYSASYKILLTSSYHCAIRVYMRMRDHILLNDSSILVQSAQVDFGWTTAQIDFDLTSKDTIDQLLSSVNDLK